MDRLLFVCAILIVTIEPCFADPPGQTGERPRKPTPGQAAPIAVRADAKNTQPDRVQREGDGPPRRGRLCLGSLVGNRVLSYQQKPTETEWYWTKLTGDRFEPLGEVMAKEAAELSQWGKPPAPPHLVDPDNFHRWRVAFGYLWVTQKVNLSGAYHQTAIRRMEFPAKAAEEGAEARRLPPRYPSAPADKLFKAKDLPQESAFIEIRAQPNLNERWLNEVSQMRFLMGMAIRARLRIRDHRASPFILDFDIVPKSAEELVLFVVADEKASVFDYRLEPARNDNGFPIWIGTWRERGTFAAPFAEPFHAAAAEGAYFLVTDSGAVYSAQETGGDWKTQTVWNNAAKPIVAMVTQSDGGTAYVFGKDFYFKLARKAEPKPCRDVTQGPREVGDPMRTVYQCARVLWEKGELKSAAAESEPQRQKGTAKAERHEAPREPRRQE